MRRIASLLVFAVACGGGDGGSGPDDAIPAELAGSWVARPACLPVCNFTFESVADPADTLNFTALGATTRFTLSRSGSFTFDSGLTAVDDLEGEMHLETGTLVVEPQDGHPEERIDYQLDGGLLRMVWRQTITYTFPNDDAPSTVRIRAVFERQ